MNSQNPPCAEILHSETPDRTADTGPVHRADACVWLLTIVAIICAVALAVLAWPVIPNFFWIPIIAFGIPAAYGIWSIYCAHRDRVEAPRSHSVLAGELGFDLVATCKGVAATAFFAPDGIVHGSSTRLLVFLENYMTRQRIVTVRLGHLPGIGRSAATYVRLHIAAGQAAVYIMPVHATPDIQPGVHHLSVLLTMEQPTGVGQRLAAARTHIRNMRTLRFAAPFELQTGRPENMADQKPLVAPRYISLASVSEKMPDLGEIIETLGIAQTH